MSEEVINESSSAAAARQKAQELFHSGYTCAQAVAATFAAKLGYDEATVLRLAQPFGGGMCRMREVCGTVSGMMMAVGMIEGGSTTDKKTKDTVYTDGQQLATRFKEQNGSIICRELLGIAPQASAPVSEARTDAYYKKRPCEQLCGDAAAIVQNWIDSRA
jgi:C_GCAxxG_C_C family probable redox protein